MIVGILQARLSSSRLPGKVLKPILGEPMLARQIERLKRSRTLERLIVATSTEPEDEAVAEAARLCGIDAHCGALDDVLDRIYQAAAPHEPVLIVRLTGDCPLADWNIVDQVVDFARQGDFDYASNTLNPTWPDGLDVEVLKFNALECAWKEARLVTEREHVTPFLYNHPERFKLGNLENDRDLSGLRWTVDEPEDFDFVTQIYTALYPANSAFTSDDILTYLSENPEIVAINASIERNEGYAQALAKITGGKQT